MSSILSMDLKLFDYSKSVLSGIPRTSCSDFKHECYGYVGFSSEFSSCRGVSVNASYSSVSKGNLVRENGLGEEYLYRINGPNDAAAATLFSSSMKMLNAYDDEYGGVVVDPNRLPVNPDSFANCLRFSLSHWRQEGKKGIWLKLPANRAELVPLAIKEGFEYHHAEPRYVMLTYWIPEGPCMLPTNATHQVGVGGFVINDKNEVLVVQERFCAPSFVGLWKIPTGFIHESEEIYTGAVREVKEETGIEAEFLEVVAFRHAHNLAFDKSDLFFVCMLKPSSNQIILDDHEIQAAKWMPLDEFVDQPLIKGDRMFKKIIDICIARLGKRYCGLSAHKLVSKFDGRLSCLYYNVVDAQSSNCIGN